MGVCVSITFFVIGIAFLVKYRDNCDDAILPVFSATSDVSITNTMLGETQVNITIESRVGPLSSVAFLNVHENENTSVVAVRAMQYYYGGSLTRIIHGGKRTVTFALNGLNYTFDPNRIFTPHGIQATLALYGPNSTEAGNIVAAFAQQLLGLYQFDSQRVVLCIHNNGPGYSAADYLMGGVFANDASQVYIADGTSPHNFFFVTTQNLFDIVTSAGFNCVLQNPVTVTDDGSLSYYASTRGIPYVNIEALAESGSQGEQVLVQLNMVQGLVNSIFLSPS